MSSTPGYDGTRLERSASHAQRHSSPPAPPALQVGTLLYSFLLLLSLLPIARLHSSLLFNQKYAEEVAARSQQRTLLNSLTAAFGLAALYHGVVKAGKWLVAVARRLAVRCCFGFVYTAVEAPTDDGGAAKAAVVAATEAPPNDHVMLAHDDLTAPGPPPPTAPEPPAVRLRGRAAISLAAAARMALMVRGSDDLRPSTAPRPSAIPEDGDYEGGPGGGSLTPSPTETPPDEAPSLSSPVRVRERSGGSKWARGARYALAQRFSEPQSVLRPVGELTRPQRHALLLGALRPLATVLAKRFGFQTTHAVPGAAGEAIPSNLANQLEHVAALLANRMDAEPQRSFEHSLQAAAESLHDKVLANYIGWVAHVGLPSVVREPRRGDSDLITLASTDVSIWGFLSAEEGAVWLLNARLNRILLYFLIWGEAANLRHAPECLCFLFYCAASSLLLPDTSKAETVVTHVPSPHLYAWVAGGNEAILKASGKLGRHQEYHPEADAAVPALELPDAPPEHFLNSVVTPLYRYLHFHVLTRAGDHIATRVMCDGTRLGQRAPGPHSFP